MVFSPSEKALFSPYVVGRTHELEILVSAFNEVAATQGKPRTIFISGEAGLGKSRLCRALTEELNRQDVTLLLGQATLQDQALSFGPFLEALRRYFQGLAHLQPELPNAMQPLMPYLLRLLPELSELFPATPPHLPPASVETNSVQEQNRLFNAILDLLRQMAEPRPMVLILEDLHWADETSLQLLSYLARDLSATSLLSDNRSPRILIVATYRSEELADSSALGRMTRQLTRQRMVEELHLGPLSNEAHRALLDAIFGQPVSPDFASALYDRTEGNPFFTEEILSAVVNAGQLRLEDGRWLRQPGLILHLPLSLRASVLERFETLDQSAQKALNYASVIGRAFDFDLLLRLTALSERELLNALRQAISLHLVSESTAVEEFGIVSVSEERYQFRHALTREGIYNELLSRERKLLHREVAQALETLAETSGQDDTERLAHHYYLAGVPEKAFLYARRAAERARHLFAFLEERYHLQIALSSLSREDPARLPLLERLGLVNLGLLDISAAMNWMNQAADGYRKLGQTRHAAVLVANLSFVIWFFDAPRLPKMLQELEEAAQAAYDGTDGQGEPDEVALELYAKVAFSHASADRHSQASLWLDRTLELVERLKSESESKEFIQTAGLIEARGVIRVDAGGAEVEAGLEDIRRTIEFGRQRNIPNLIMLGYSTLLTSLIELGRVDEIDNLIEELELYEARSGSPPNSNIKAYWYFTCGRWQDGINLLLKDIEQTGRMGTSTTNALDRVILSHFLIERGQLEEALAHLETALPLLEPLQQFIYVSYCLWGLAKLFALQNRPERATQYYLRCYELWKQTEDRGTVVPVLLDGIIFFQGRSDIAHAKQWLDELRQVARQTANPVAVAALLEAEGHVLGGDGRTEAAIKRLSEAADSWENLKRPYRLAATLTALANLQLSGSPTRERRDEAARALSDATAIYERLEVPVALKTIAEISETSALNAQEKRRKTMQAARQPFGDLTPREREVLSYLTAGRTNKEIATQLHISEGTVELHVSRILGKLGCDTRTQAAAYAVEKGWAKSQHETL